MFFGHFFMTGSFRECWPVPQLCQSPAVRTQWNTWACDIWTGTTQLAQLHWHNPTGTTPLAQLNCSSKQCKRQKG